ncbi:FAM192A [Branchiostoma lanceolatum]|uniref:FAM192A protein n=1 Tax=Branchiostoma lanceolatum TaxID=7740 RepID=A0A8K0A8A7_BRALA|nr:FAM192A [Branchiostoma lanceolatum]
MSGSGISFVTEAQVEETKKKRQEEWEKVRTADEPEVLDNQYESGRQYRSSSTETFSVLDFLYWAASVLGALLSGLETECFRAYTEPVEKMPPILGPQYGRKFRTRILVRNGFIPVPKLQCPEEEYDPRSLFDRLEEQKEKKQAEFEEQFKFKNQFRGLEEEETNFLGEVDNIRAKIERQKRQEEWDAEEAATSSTSQPHQEQSAKRPTPKPITNQPRKSQQALLAGAVKRKRSSSDDVKDTSSLPKATKSEDSSSHDTETAHVPDDSRTTTDNTPAVELQTAQVVAVLPGLGAYNYSSDSSEASSDESDVIEVVPILMKGCAGTAASKLAAGGKHQHHRH